MDSQGSGKKSPSPSKGKVDKRNFMYINQSGQELVKKPGDINGNAFKLSILEDCTIWLLDHCAQIYGDDCENCQLYVGPVKSSIQLRNFHNCTVAVACQQFRCTSCENCIFYVCSNTQPTIESSTNVTFAPYNLGYPGLDGHFTSAGVNPKYNLWKHIHDMTAAPGEVTWNLMPPSEFSLVPKAIEGLSDPVFPVPLPKTFGGTLEEHEEPGVQPEETVAFSIATSKDEAARQQEALESVPVEEFKGTSPGMTTEEVIQEQPVDFGILEPDYPPPMKMATEVFTETEEIPLDPGLLPDPNANVYEAAAPTQSPPVSAYPPTAEPLATPEIPAYAVPAAETYAVPAPETYAATTATEIPNSYQDYPPTAEEEKEIGNEEAPIREDRAYIIEEQREEEYSPDRHAVFYEALEKEQEAVQNEEDLQLIEDVKNAQIDHRAQLEEKDREEKNLKRGIRTRAAEELQQMIEDRKREILERRERNKEEEAAFIEMRTSLKISKNPWEKVISHVEIKEGNYPGNKDVSRMRQAMVSRRNDVKQGIIHFS